MPVPVPLDRFPVHRPRAGRADPDAAVTMDNASVKAVPTTGGKAMSAAFNTPR